MITVLTGLAAVTLVLACLAFAGPIARAIQHRRRIYYAKHVVGPQLVRIWNMYPPQPAEHSQLRAAA